ncbi:hypothetical protein EV359DRAFT_66211 [Lentinula novae-zelandiae]|nr:hypothetical protein EV359DRAFT_66211 [Lentinula novae-zelandiae]
MTLCSALVSKAFVVFSLLLLSITVVTANPVIGQRVMRVEVKYLEGTISIPKTSEERTQVDTTNTAIEKLCTLLVGLLDHQGGVNELAIGKRIGTVAQDGKKQKFEITIGSFPNSRSYTGQVTWTGTKKDDNMVVSGLLNHLEGNRDLVATVENGHIVKVSGYILIILTPGAFRMVPEIRMLSYYHEAHLKAYLGIRTSDIFRISKEYLSD